MLNEILRSEKRAEQVLRRNWAAVCDIATSLHRSKVGHLNRKQLLSCLERHGVKHGSTFRRSSCSRSGSGRSARR